jgi:hypothetical protein
MANSQNVRANIGQLYQASGILQRKGETLIGIHQASHGELENAQHGWVGSSSGALTAMLENWSSVAIDHTARFVNHATGLHTSASCFAEMTDEHVAALAAASPKPGPKDRTRPSK